MADNSKYLVIENQFVVSIGQHIDTEVGVSLSPHVIYNAMFGGLDVSPQTRYPKERVFAHFRRFDIRFGHLLDVADCVAVSANDQTDHKRRDN